MQDYLRWANPDALKLLWLVPLLVALYVYAARMRARAMARIATPEALRRITTRRIRRRRLLRAALMTLGLTLLLIAAARPQFGTKMERVQRTGVDVLFAVDVSRSMLARDIKPDRLSMAKETVQALISRMRGDRVGIVAFAGDAFLYCPLTVDYGAARMFLDALDTQVVGAPGTALSQAIAVALEGTGAAEHKYHHLVILTDGEDHRGGAVAAAREAAQKGLTIHVIGIGTAEGEPIPEIGAEGEVTRYTEGEDGRIVLSALDEKTLKEIAEAGGGIYASAAGGAIPVERVFTALQREEGRLVGTWQFEDYEERFQLPLGIAIVLIAICAIIPDGARVRQ